MEKCTLSPDSDLAARDGKKERKAGKKKAREEKRGVQHEDFPGGHPS